MTRPRKHIPLEQKLAATLACLLPPEQRKFLRDTHVSAAYVIRLFTFDHVVLHAWDGSDKWFNLDPKLRGPILNLKDRADTSRAAKVRRIDDKWKPFMRAMARGRKPPRRASRWPKRRMRK